MWSNDACSDCVVIAERIDDGEDEKDDGDGGDGKDGLLSSTNGGEARSRGPEGREEGTVLGGSAERGREGSCGIAVGGWAGTRLGNAPSRFALSGLG